MNRAPLSFTRWKQSGRPVEVSRALSGEQRSRYSRHILIPEMGEAGQIRLPEICSNVCFGGTKRNRLFMTASQSLYAVYVETRGAHIT